MQNRPLLEETQWVATLFQKVLDFIKELEFTRQSPSIFLVYAHDSEAEIAADAAVAQKVIQWLKDLDAHIYSDRSSDGNYFAETREHPLDTKRAQDILSSQLCLLPKASKDTVDCVILCGSALLGDYLQSDYYQSTYLPELKSVYAMMQSQDNDRSSALSDYINTQVKEKQRGFHHVLTELAFLELGIKAKTAYRDIVPFLLNGQHTTSFPDWVTASTVIRIEDAIYREPGYWKSEPTYQDQGLHLAFFKLLKRLWKKEAAAIQIIEEEVYQTGLRSLQQGEQRVHQSEIAIKKVIERFRKEAITKWRADAIEAAWTRVENRVEAVVKRALEQREKDSKLEVEQQLSAWYPSLADASVTRRLAIQRISGEPLPMEHCYINLGVVAYQPKQDRDKASKQLFYRLRSAEAVTNTNTSDPIALADLFKPRRLKSGVTGIPKRILIRGRAGIGKTTLSKKSMYDHIHHQHWTEQFDYVLWIRLRHLKGKPKSYPLKTLLHEEYFEGDRHGWELAESLHHRIKKDPHKTLFMLDGWDEIAQEPSINCLHTLVNHPAVIITSRPHGVSVKTFQNIDLELETIGFSQANVMAYLDHREIVDDPNAATAIKTFIQQHPFVQELVNIPIQLDALCYSWELIQDCPQPVETMTGLYQVMIEQLWRKDIVRLGKQEQGSLITKEQAQSMLRFEPLLEQEEAYLEVLAVNGLYDNQIEFNQAYLTAIAQQFKEERDQSLPSGFEESIARVSCLQVEIGKRSNRLQSCQFLHLTFQEFFAAQSIAKAFTRRQPLALLKTPAITADAFIRQYKYDPRYEIVWWLVAGLLEKEALIQFFGLLDDEPQDLIGIQHQYLLMHCLRESHGKLPKHQKQSLLSHLRDWLDVEIMTVLNRGETSSFSNVLFRAHLGSQDAFPEELLIGCLTKECGTVTVKKIILNTLKERHRCSHSAIQTLIRLLEDTDPDVREVAARALQQQSPLAPAGVEALIRLLEHTDSRVSHEAVWVLCHQSPLAPAGVGVLIRSLQNPNFQVRNEASRGLKKQSPLAPAEVEALIRLLQDPGSGAAWSAARELKRQSPLAPEFVETLIRLLEHTDSRVRKSAAWSLGEQSPLAPGGVEALIRLLEHTDSEVRWKAAEALKKQSPLAPAGVEALIRLLQDPNSGVRWTAANVLEQQSPLASEFVEALIHLLQDPNSGVRWTAANVLEQQSALAPEFVEALIPLFQDPDSEVRAVAAKALGKQSPLAPAGVEALIPLLQDPDSEVRAVAAKALGKQSPLAPAGVEALIPLLQDADAQVRQAAAKALGKQSPLAPEFVEALIRLLQDANAQVRQEAAEVLGKQSPLAPAGVEALMRLLEDTHIVVMWAAARALKKQSTLAPAGVEALIRLLQDPDSTVRQATAEALGRQSTLPPAGVEALIRLLQDPDPKVRWAEARALGRQSPLASAGVEALIRLLQDPNPKVRTVAAEALEKQSPLPPAGVEVLIRLLQDPDADVRQAAAIALGQQSALAPAGVETLIPLLQDPEFGVRQASARALGQQSSLVPEVVEALIPLLQDPHPSVREASARALGKQSALAPAGVEALIRLLQDPEFGVSKASTEVLAKQSPLPPAGIEVLIHLLQDLDSGVRRAAASILEQQSPLSPAGVEALIRLLQDLDPKVREAAAEALKHQSPLAPAGVESLIHLLQNPDPEVRKWITFVLNDQDSWNIYRLLPTMNPSLLTAVYSHSMISYNFIQPAPLYLQSGVLHFYTPEGLETVPLHKKEISFKQTILKAQQAIGIPTASQIRLQGSAWRSSSGSYDRFFPMPGAWPLENDDQPTLGL